MVCYHFTWGNEKVDDVLSKVKWKRVEIGKGLILQTALAH